MGGPLATLKEEEEEEDKDISLVTLQTKPGEEEEGKEKVGNTAKEGGGG